MRIDIITIFPEMFDSYFGESIIKRASERKLVKITAHNLRDFTKDKHHKVDDKPYGGGAGMVMKPEPIAGAVVKIAKPKLKKRVILFSAKGKLFDQKAARRLAKYDQLIFICGRYEGVDERVAERVVDEELSIGDFVLTGGELAAMVVADAVARHIPGVLGKAESLEEKRYGAGVPAYTRPEVFTHKGKKFRVPKVLLGGNHKEIEEWRKMHRK